MGTKRTPSIYAAYDKAETDEPFFTLLGRDRHAPALIQLWAEMREREGEDQDVVNDARNIAEAMTAYAQAKARLVMSLAAVANFITSVYKPGARSGVAPAAPPRPKFHPKLHDYVVPLRGGAIGTVTALFDEHDDSVVRDKLADHVNVKFGRAPGAVTIPLANLRAPTEEELAAAGLA